MIVSPSSTTGNCLLLESMKPALTPPISTHEGTQRLSTKEDVARYFETIEEVGQSFMEISMVDMLTFVLDSPKWY